MLGRQPYETAPAEKPLLGIQNASILGEGNRDIEPRKALDVPTAGTRRSEGGRGVVQITRVLSHYMPGAPPGGLPRQATLDNKALTYVWSRIAVCIRSYIVKCC